MQSPKLEHLYACLNDLSQRKGAYEQAARPWLLNQLSKLTQEAFHAIGIAIDVADIARRDPQSQLLDMEAVEKAAAYLGEVIDQMPEHKAVASSQIEARRLLTELEERLRIG
jgi:hypothetical protein